MYNDSLTFTFSELQPHFLEVGEMMTDKKTKKENIKQVSDFLLKDFYKKNRVSNWIINFSSVFSSLLEVSIAWMMQYALNSISEKKPLNEFIFSMIITIVVLGLIMIIRYGMERMKNTFVAKFCVHVKEKMFQAMIQKDIIEFEKYNTGEYLSAFQVDILRLSANYIMGKWTIIQYVS